jgi:RND family efflux transporter MFP subunit
MTDWRYPPPSDTQGRWWTALGAALGAAGAAAVLLAHDAGGEPEHASSPRAFAAPARGALLAEPPREAPARRASPVPAGRSAARTPGAASARSGGSSFACALAAFEQIEVGSAVRGTLRDVYVERGDHVQAGQLLASLDWSAERAALELAQARAEHSRKLRASAEQAQLHERHSAIALHRHRGLSPELRALSERVAALEDFRARDDEAQAHLQLEQARAGLQRRMIVSPLAGVVVERMLSRGELVDAQPILRIARIDRLSAEVVLPASLFGALVPGDLAEITPEPPYDQPLAARVLIADPVLDGASGTFLVRLALPNPDLRLPGGLRCHARFPAVSS